MTRLFRQNEIVQCMLVGRSRFLPLKGQPMQTSTRLDPKSLLGFKLQSQTLVGQIQAAATGAKVGKKPPAVGVAMGAKVGKKPPSKLLVILGAKIGKGDPNA